MDETVMLILLVIIMLIGSYMAGNIPLVMSLSEAKLKNVTIFGAGLLIGTALAVIIPEGVNALYSDRPPRPRPSLPTGPVSLTADQVEHIGHEHSDGDEFSATIGLSLVLGFIFMMLVDQISSRRGETTSSMTATIGLVVHAAADGVALGAAARTSHEDVEIIVFLAIMLHKAPASFGLVSFLLHEGMDRQKIRKHLGIFSLSAPLLTLITYFGIGQEQKETLNNFNATGIAMLFSAGTFLYVATVHVLPELTSSQHSHSHPHVAYNQLEQPSAVTSKTGGGGYSGLKNSELLFLVVGALFPCILTLGHHH